MAEGQRLMLLTTESNGKFEFGLTGSTHVIYKTLNETVNLPMNFVSCFPTKSH